MSTFNLSVTIDTGILPTLVQAGYKLCIAKKVNGAYTVVWQGSNILVNNQFSWTAQYQVFGSIPFKSGALFGIMNPATGAPDNSGQFKVQNNYGLINLGVNSYVNGSYAPSYVSTNPVVSGPTTLQPIETVLVWFDTQVTTSTMILQASSQAIEVDFTSIPSHTLLFKAPDGAPPGKGVWFLDSSQAVLPMTYNLSSNNFTVTQPDDSTIALMTDLVNSRPTVGVVPAFTSPVTCAVEYATQADATAFKEYVTPLKPEGFTMWIVSQTKHTVSVTTEVEVAINQEAAIRTVTDKFLDILYAFKGTPYKKLTMTVNGRQGNPHQTGQPTGSLGSSAGGTIGNASGCCYSTTGTAVVRFHTDKQASLFAEQVNEGTSKGVKMQATTRGLGVTVKFQASGARETARRQVRQTYDAAIAAFECLPGGAAPVYIGPIMWGTW
ncbi:hypothetical protein C8Q77DRAFT_1057829 [Trametes polyzona]|nr:hypothetical protein C8Q77DRAFT_1057829 [Trametes polyzona]